MQALIIDSNFMSKSFYNNSSKLIKDRLTKLDFELLFFKSV